MRGKLKVMIKLRYSIYIHFLFGSLCLRGAIVTQGFHQPRVLWLHDNYDMAILNVNSKRCRAAVTLHTTLFFNENPWEMMVRGLRVVGEYLSEPGNSALTQQEINA